MPAAEPTAEDRRAGIESALKNGARGIGELRYEGETPFTTSVIELARDFNVPILFHFQESGNAQAVYANFHRYIEKYPTVKFIGHAIDWWGAIDKNYSLAGGNYPRGRVTPGGLTDHVARAATRTSMPICQPPPATPPCFAIRTSRRISSTATRTS